VFAGMSAPVVTVCVPVFDAAPYIKQCIKSVLAQEFKDWILLVADNCSTDGTWEILQKFQHPQIKLFRHPRNLGPVANWNFVLEKAETEFVCFLGSDDYFYPNHLGNKVRLLERFPEAPFVHGPADFVNEIGEPIRPEHVAEQPALTENSNKGLKRLLQSNYINITTVVFRRKALVDFNLKFDPRLRLFIDWQLYMELMLHHPFIACDRQATAVYRIHPASDARQNIKSFLWAYESVRFRVDSLLEHPAVWRQIGVDPEAEARLLTKLFWRVAFQQVRRGNFANAKRAWNLFREFHSRSDALYDLPRHLGTGVRKAIGRKNLEKAE
jgi:glycosyltransferase involved in cell wall biosynthesis